MSAARFLKLLEDSGMLDDATISELRDQIADAKHRVTAESIAKALVDKGHLTKFQATRLVGQATEGEEKTEKKKKSKKAKPREAADDDLGLAPTGEDDLGLAPLDGEEKEEVQEKKPAAATPPPDDEGVVMLEDASEPVDGLTPVEDAGAGLTPVGDAGPGLTPVPPQPAGMGPLPDDGSALSQQPGPASLDPFADAAAEATSTPATMPSQVQKKKAAGWGSKLIFGSAIALPLLVFFGVMLYINLTKTPALEMFEAAMADYRSESYSQAKAKFENFLKSYPEDENASEARVRIALADMRLAVNDPQRGLDTVKELIPTIVEEEKFSLAREEFAGILPMIPEGFITKAKATNNMKQAEELIELAQEGLDLVLDPSNIPTSIRIRIDKRVERIVEDIALVRRAIEQDKNLERAIAEIEVAVRGDDTQAAYQIYKDLLKVYPGLENNEQLLTAVGRITEKVRVLVKTTSENPASVTTEPESKSEFEVVLATRSGDGSPRAKGQVAPVLAGGSVYGLDAGTGELLWRRFVGPETSFFPVRLSDQADADIVIASASSFEVMRCGTDTGKVVWRLPVGEPFFDPVVAGRNLYVATESGEFFEIDAETGNANRGSVLPQRLQSPPGVASNRPRAFQPGEHSNLYVMSTDTLECKDVFYLGHKAGSVTLPPLVLLKYVFLVENAGRDYSLLHILTIRTEGDGPSLRHAQESIRFKGNIRVPVVAYGKQRVLVLTDRGEVRVFDVDITDADEPVKDAASKTAQHDRPVIGYPLTDASSLWVADDRLTNYRIQVTTKEITRNPNVANIGDTFMAPLQQFQDTLVHVRRAKDSAGVIVAAVNIDNPRKPLWETHLGVPAGRVQVDPEQGEILAITAAGSLFEIDRDALTSGITDQPKLSIRGGGSKSFTQAIELSGNRVALLNPADHQHLLVYDPAAGTPLQNVELGLPDVKISASPVAFQDGLLLPLERGVIAFVDPASGAEKTLPFQPRLEPGETIAWRSPATIDGQADTVIVADDRRNLYRVGLKDQPRPFLAELEKARLDVQVTTPLASVGDMVYGGVHSEGTDTVVAIGVKDLKVGQEWDLEGGRVTWGPHRVGDTVLIVVDGKQLWCFETGGKTRWEKPAALPAQPVGFPLLDGSDFVFASHGGAVWRTSGGNGELAGQTNVGEPLSTGPVAYSGRLLLCGNDGALHVIPTPAGS
jgi:outer membrane protein assembly factor BamB/TolA-binding protein